MSIKDAFRPLLNFASCRLTDILLVASKRKRWSIGEMHKTYFTHYALRTPLIHEISDLLKSNSIKKPRIIEFGCSGGNNFKLMQEIIELDIQYVGIDINENAIEFARSKFKNATFYKSDDRQLPELEPALGHFDVMLISGVLYYLPQKEAWAVLNLAARISDYLVVYDDLSRFDLPTGKTTGLFIHPFGLMLKQIGFDVILPPHKIREGDPDSVFIARSLSDPVLELDGFKHQVQRS